MGLNNTLCLRTATCGEYFDAKREEVIGQCKKFLLRNILTCIISIILLEVIKSGRMTWAVHIASTGTIRNTYEYLYEKIKGRTLGRPGLRLEVDIKTNL
jgi:hypothetical protein